MSNIQDFFGGKTAILVNPPKAATDNFRPDLATATFHMEYLDIFMSPDGDGSWLDISTVTNAYVKYGADGVADWSIAHTDINAAATQWIHGVMWDTVDDLIYVCAASSSNLYFASIAPIAGTITNIATIAHTLSLSSNVYYQGIQRAINGSGDFTIIMGTKAIDFDVTGSVTVAEAVRFGANYSGYVTEDGIGLSLAVADAETNSSSITGSLGIGGQVTFYIPPEFGIAVQVASGFSVIGNSLALRCNTGSSYGRRYFDRADFDRFMRDLAKSAYGAEL
ncbi:MAG: hypothetical protein PVF17_00250 [Ignavibacteria bacterium]